MAGYNFVSLQRSQINVLKRGREFKGIPISNNNTGVCQLPESSGEHGEMENIVCKVICISPMTLVSKGLVVVVMMMMMAGRWGTYIRATFKVMMMMPMPMIG